LEQQQYNIEKLCPTIKNIQFHEGKTHIIDTNMLPHTYTDVI